MAPLTGERAAECERALWGESAAWRRVFASSVVPEPTAEPGRGDIMGRMTAGSIARVLRLEADEGLLAAAQRNLAALNTVAALECAAVQRTPNLGAAAVAYCFSQGLKDDLRRGDAAAAVLAACRATPTLRLILVVHDAREKKHALVAFAERGAGAAASLPS